LNFSVLIFLFADVDKPYDNGGKHNVNRKLKQEVKSYKANQHIFANGFKAEPLAPGVNGGIKNARQPSRKTPVFTTGAVNARKSLQRNNVILSALLYISPAQSRKARLEKTLQPYRKR
jgi:hypothetical protein